MLLERPQSLRNTLQRPRVLRPCRAVAPAQSPLQGLQGLPRSLGCLLLPLRRRKGTSLKLASVMGGWRRDVRPGGVTAAKENKERNDLHFAFGKTSKRWFPFGSHESVYHRGTPLQNTLCLLKHPKRISGVPSVGFARQTAEAVLCAGELHLAAAIPGAPLRSQELSTCCSVCELGVNPPIRVALQLLCHSLWEMCSPTAQVSHLFLLILLRSSLSEVTSRCS